MSGDKVMPLSSLTLALLKIIFMSPVSQINVVDISRKLEIEL